MMKETKKIDALKGALNLLRNDQLVYDWHSPLTDNVGFLATALTGHNTAELMTALKPEKAFSQLWTDMIRLAYFDMTAETGLPKNEVFAEFYKADFTRKEIHELEFLSNDQIKKDIDLLYFEKGQGAYTNGIFNHRSNVILYVENWVKLLNEQVIVHNKNGSN